MTNPGGRQFDPYDGEPVPHQYGGGSTYRGFGAYDEPPPNRKPLAVAVAVAVVVAAAAVGVFFLADGEDGGMSAQQQSAAPPVPSSSSSVAPSFSSAPETSSRPGRDDAKVSPVVDGWQAVLSTKESVAYDVSKDWEVLSPDTVTGFENGDGVQTIMHGVASYRSGFCEESDGGSSRAEAGFMTAGDATPKTVAPIAAKLWATTAAELPEDSDKVTPSDAERVDIAGGQQAWMSTAAVQGPKKSTCPPDELTVITVAFTPKKGGDTALFVLHFDSRVDDELPAEEAEKIIGSLRPVGD